MTSRRDFLLGASAALLPVPVQATNVSAPDFIAKFNPNVVVAPVSITFREFYGPHGRTKERNGAAWGLCIGIHSDEDLEMFVCARKWGEYEVKTSLYIQITRITTTSGRLYLSCMNVADVQVEAATGSECRNNGGHSFAPVLSDERLLNFATQLVHKARTEQNQRKFMQAVKKELSRRIKMGNPFEVAF